MIKLGGKGRKKEVHINVSKRLKTPYEISHDYKQYNKSGKVSS